MNPMHSTTPNPKVALSRWAVTLVETLIPVEMRLEADDALAHAFETDPTYINGWFAGVITSIAASLPAEDPWRNLAVTYIDGTGSKRHYYTSLALPLETTGARTRGRIFGSRRDHTGLVAPAFHDPHSDVGLAVVSKEVAAETAALIGVAGHADRATTHELIELIQNDPQWDGQPARLRLRILTDALRFVMHRRRVYVGANDNFDYAMLIAWITWAEDILRGRAVDTSLLASEGKIPDGDYTRFHVN